MTLEEAWATIRRPSGGAGSAAWEEVDAALRREAARQSNTHLADDAHAIVMTRLFGLARQKRLLELDSAPRIRGYLRKAVKNVLIRLHAGGERREELEALGKEDGKGGERRPRELPSQDPSVEERLLHAEEEGRRGDMARAYLKRAEALLRGLARRMIDGRLLRYRSEGERTWLFVEAYYLRREPLDGLIFGEERKRYAGAALTQARNRWYRRLSNFTDGLRGQLAAEWEAGRHTAAEHKLVTAYMDRFLTRFELSGQGGGEI